MSKFSNPSLSGQEVDDIEQRTIDSHMLLFRERYGDRVKVVRSGSQRNVYLIFVNGKQVWDFNPYLLDGNTTAEAMSKIEDQLLLG